MDENCKITEPFLGTSVKRSKFYYSRYETPNLDLIGMRAVINLRMSGDRLVRNFEISRMAKKHRKTEKSGSLSRLLSPISMSTFRLFPMIFFK